MGQHKDEMIRREESLYNAAERDGRRCPICVAVIPYGTDPGPHGECPSCAHSLAKDD